MRKTEPGAFLLPSATRSSAVAVIADRTAGILRCAQYMGALKNFESPD